MCPDDENNIRQAKSMIQGAVFICGILPQKWESLKSGHMEDIKPDDLTEETLMKIDIKTTHAYSLEDGEFSGQSQGLLKLCEESKRTEVLHTAGHDVPRLPDEVDILSRAISTQCRALDG